MDHLKPYITGTRRLFPGFFGGRIMEIHTLEAAIGATLWTGEDWNMECTI